MSITEISIVSSTEIISNVSNFKFVVYLFIKYKKVITILLLLKEKKFYTLKTQVEIKKEKSFFLTRSIKTKIYMKTHTRLCLF